MSVFFDIVHEHVLDKKDMNHYFVFLRQGTSQRNTDKRGAFLFIVRFDVKDDN